MKLELENCDYGDDSFIGTVIGSAIPDSINIKIAIESLPEILGLLFAVNDSPYVQYNIQFWRELDKILKKVIND